MPKDINVAGLRTKAPVVAVPVKTHRVRVPEFLSMPPIKGVEHFSQLGRSMINTLILPCAANQHRPPVRSISLRRNGAKKGKRLVCAEGVFPNGQMGLLTFLRKLRDEPSASSEKPAATREPVLQNT